MRYLVNGIEVDLNEDPAVVVSPLSDRLIVMAGGKSQTALVRRRGDVVAISYGGKIYEIERIGAKASHKPHHGTGDVVAPMPGQMVEVLVTVGQLVKAGDKLAVLEAMKMQQGLIAPFDGLIEKVTVAAGDQVSEGQLLVLVTERAE